MSLYFEFVIFFFLIVVGAYSIDLIITLKHAKRKRLSVVLIVLLIISWLVIFYGSFVEPRMLTTREFEVSLEDNSSRSLKAVVLADWHLGPYKNEAWVKRVVAQVNDLKPDIVFLVGDYVFQYGEQVEMLYPITGLQSKYGVFAVTGNHDYYDGNDAYVIESLERYGAMVLQNESVKLDIEGEDLFLAGVNDLWYYGSSLTALAGAEEEDKVILLAHNPDAVQSGTAIQADLVISGHTHGGQIRLPWIGAVASLPTVLGRDYDRWLLEYQGEQFFVTPGLGEIGPRARLFNLPEISVLNIKI